MNKKNRGTERRTLTLNPKPKSGSGGAKKPPSQTRRLRPQRRPTNGKLAPKLDRPPAGSARGSRNHDNPSDPKIEIAYAIDYVCRHARDREFVMWVRGWWLQQQCTPLTAEARHEKNSDREAQTAVASLGDSRRGGGGLVMKTPRLGQGWRLRGCQMTTAFKIRHLKWEIPRIINSKIPRLTFRVRDHSVVAPPPHARKRARSLSIPSVIAHGILPSTDALPLVCVRFAVVQLWVGRRRWRWRVCCGPCVRTQERGEGVTTFSPSSSISGDGGAPRPAISSALFSFHCHCVRSPLRSYLCRRYCCCRCFLLAFCFRDCGPAAEYGCRAFPAVVGSSLCAVAFPRDCARESPCINL